jgi:DNA-directed RNA polymerase specialized sigma24 family protein
VLYDWAARRVRAVAADPGPDAAEDATHDTFLRACWTLNIKRDPARVAPWLVGIA